jgi:outer membrane protein
MHKKLSLLALLVLVLVSAVSAEKITKVAVVDLNKVMAFYYNDSRVMQEIEKKRKEFQTEILRMNDEIKDLETKKQEAKKKGDDTRALELDKEIFQKKEYLKEYIKVKEQQLSQMNDRASQQLTMAEDIVNAIRFVSESNGFSLVLNSADPHLIWWGFDVDITDLVLKELSKK